MPRTRTLLGVPLVTMALVACGAGDAPPVEFASPSAACEDAFRTAAEEAELADTEARRSPDVDALGGTLEACGTSQAWLTAARGHPDALPLEIDRETALDLLCEQDGGTPVCEDWSAGAPAEE